MRRSMQYGATLPGFLKRTSAVAPCHPRCSARCLARGEGRREAALKHQPSLSGCPLRQHCLLLSRGMNHSRSKLKGMKMKELKPIFKALAKQRGLKEVPEGDGRSKNTWVDAIIAAEGAHPVGALEGQKTSDLRECRNPGDAPGAQQRAGG